MNQKEYEKRISMLEEQVQTLQETNHIDGDANTQWNPVMKDMYKSFRDVHHIRRSYWNQSLSVYYSNQDCLFTEFKTNYPVTPCSYTLTTASNNASNPSGRPRTWVLLGKKKASDPWTMLDAEETAGALGIPKGNALPKGNLIEKEYFFNGTQPDGFQYFRFEVINTWNDDDNAHMQIGEFRFNYTLPW